MAYHETPEWIRAKPIIKDDDMELGKRERKKMNCQDELSEAQWYKIFEEGKDIKDEIERAREKK